MDQITANCQKYFYKNWTVNGGLLKRLAVSCANFYRQDLRSWGKDGGVWAGNARPNTPN